MPLSPPPWRRTRSMRRSCSMPKLVRKGNLRRKGTSISSNRSIFKVVLLTSCEGGGPGLFFSSSLLKVDAQVRPDLLGAAQAVTCAGALAGNFHDEGLRQAERRGGGFPARDAGGADPQPGRCQGEEGRGELVGEQHDGHAFHQVLGQFVGGAGVAGDA